jgi:hypothetical protein
VVRYYIKVVFTYAKGSIMVMVVINIILGMTI